MFWFPVIDSDCSEELLAATGRLLYEYIFSVHRQEIWNHKLLTHVESTKHIGFEATFTDFEAN